MHKVKIITADSYEELEKKLNTFLKTDYNNFHYDPTIHVSDRRILATVEYEYSEDEDSSDNV
jgi:hypothetical protein